MWGGRSKEGPPVSSLGGFEGLEVALLGEVGNCTIGRQVRGVGFACGGGEFISEEGKQGGPPGLRTIEGALGVGVGGKEHGEGER